MFEILDILDDIRSGALPASELPGFIAWAIGKTFWLWFAVLVIGGIAIYAL